LIQSIKVVESDHTQNFQTLLAFALELRCPSRPWTRVGIIIYSLYIYIHQWLGRGRLVLIIETQVGSDLAEVTCGLDRWKGKDEDASTAKDMLVKCEDGRSEDPEEMWEVHGWIHGKCVGISLRGSVQ
jgi:hypothetical protein